MDTTQPSQQNTFHFDYPHENNPKLTSTITFSSVFDSGNLREAISVAPDTYILHTAPDCYGTQYEGTQKSWFYYSVKGVPSGVALNFVIKKISILSSLYKSAPESYRPVCKINNGGAWKRIEGTALLQEDPVEKTLDVKFSHVFSSPNDEVFFAFSFPFSYTESQQLLARYDGIYAYDPDIYYHHEVIIKSPHDRAIDLITISSNEGRLIEMESSIDENLFPNNGIRAQKFRGNKPVILITARVHPGETPASHTMNGILKFLLDKKDIRAQMLRNYFVFMVMPMINPDGVANGHYRMDIYNQNLNRYYRNPDLKKQPAIYAVKKMIEYLHSENRLFFFCDLHAHAAKKGCFLYGNAMDFVTQVESMLYSRVIGLNCINFEPNSCNFSEKHMKARDKGEKLTKEGAARVCAFKICNLIHSYTLECGLHFSNELNRITMPSSATSKEWYEGEVADINSEMYKETPTYYTIDIYEDLGKSMLISILDTFEKNPCSRIPIGALDTIRREIAAKIMKYPRFWKESNIKKKCQKITEAIKEILHDEFERKNVFSSSMVTVESQPTISSIKKSAGAGPISQGPSTARSFRKPIVNIAGKEKGFLKTDENVEEDVERYSLPPLKTLLPKESRMRQTFDLKIPNLERLLKEEYFNGFFDKKSSMQNTQRSIERVLTMTESNTNRDIRSPGRFNMMRREEKPSNHQFQISGEASKYSRKSTSVKPKNRNPLEKKRTMPGIRLPELEVTPQVEGSVDQHPLLFMVGGKNYTISKHKKKMSGSQTLRKQK